MEKKSLSASAEQPSASPQEADANPPPPTAAAAAAPPFDNTIHVEGILDIDATKGGNGQLLDMVKNGKRRPTDTFVPKELIRRFKLKAGSLVGGTAFPPEGRFPNPKMRYIETVDGMALEERRGRLDFSALTTVSPDKHLKLEMKDGRMTTRAVDLFCPIGKGTRGLIVAPPRTGKTILLRDMALGILENNPECHVMILLVDERPEEVTDFKRSVPAEIWASSNDEQIENHLSIADLCIERAKRLVEAGQHVLLFLDSLTPRPPQHRGGRLAHDHRLRPCRNRKQDGRRDLPGIQGHGQHGACPRPQVRRDAALARHQRGLVGHAQGGAPDRREEARGHPLLPPRPRAAEDRGVDRDDDRPPLKDKDQR